ncbi:hypothetical protein Lfu02_00190 [Longispora fulva]|uniref:Transcriptional regulator with XRE-family HTH domain/tetratricopeptide (TPR) repeat protein n=1 Tax=Longispora fulva TaxID=619741 RepID=A0A8J7GQB5_9ACTN|nr:XRE family transcriptional regulator [Longispora fulva]MBG6136108.1 transcriptional regulator with XRE-family HTH domain/tetratricopeptide (TPR) repeat protein [Longispora fulva]GIG55647.1 hypothetical protein Lfu02_00190 [Longispora fulva]
MGEESSFAVALRMLRRAAGLTLEELAEGSGVSVRALSDMERGRALGPQRRTVALIADTLKLEGVGRDELFALAKAGRTRQAYLAAAPGLAELPGSIADFTGRAAELAWLTRLADTLQELGDRSGAAVVSGGAGLGKTTLVVRAAHRLRDHFPGGVLFVDALGMSRRPVGSDELLARLLRALGVRDQQIPRDGAERAGRYRQLLRERRVLVVIDDAASEAQVRPVLPGDGHSLLLVTSWRLLAGLEGVRRLQLAPMPAVDASDLLSRILTERLDVPHTDDVRGLVELLGGLPLALRIVGNRLISRPGWSAADLAARLSIAERRLQQLSAGDLTVAAAFGMSYEQLPASTRLVFRRAALVPGADFSSALAGVVADVSVPVVEDELDDLVDLGLMDTAPGGRYRFHDLVRLYAHQRLEQEDAADAVAAVRRRMVTWLLTTVTAAGRVFGPGAGEAGDAGFDGVADAEAWIRVEAEHWFPALGDAAVAGDHHDVVRAASALHWFSDRWNYWSRWPDVFTLALDSAVALGDAARQAEFLNHLAWAHTQPWRDCRQGLGYAQRALVLAREAGDVRQEAWAWQFTAVARINLGEWQAASDAVRAAADRFEQAGDIDAFCQSLLGRGALALKLRDVTGALADFQRALQLVEDPASGMTPSIAAATLPEVLGQTALTLRRLGRAGEGVPLLLRATDLFGELRIALSRAKWLRILGRDFYGADHPVKARESLLAAAEIYDSIGQPDEAAGCRETATAIGSGDGGS